MGCADAAGTRPASAVQERGDFTLAPHSSRVSGTVFRDAMRSGGEGPEMVVLPTGSFQMGSPATETGRDRNEGPVRTVTISRRIAMGRYEVTFADYDRFVAATSGRRIHNYGYGSDRGRPNDYGWGRRSRRKNFFAALMGHHPAP